MNKQDFIERLNLYLDKELSAEESEELLNAVRENPEYHRLYVQYCQIFNACSQLGEDFAEGKPVSQWRQKAYAIGGLAAAGALLFLAGRNLSPLMSGGADQGGTLTSIDESTALVDEETFLVVDANRLDGQRVLFADGFVPVTFDIESAFDRGDAPLNFGSDSRVSFVLHSSEQAEHSDKDWAKKEFKFGSAVPASTFAHESFSLGEDDGRVFTIEALGASFREEAALEFSKVAATKSAPTR